MHRLGLVPLKVNPGQCTTGVSVALRNPSEIDADCSALNKSAPPHVTDTLVFNLRVRCEPHTRIAGGDGPEKMYYDSNVYSGMIEWEPSGDQKRTYRGSPPRPRCRRCFACQAPPRAGRRHVLLRPQGTGADHASSPRR